MTETTNVSHRDPSRKLQAIEVGVFLLLIFPPMLLSGDVPNPDKLSFPLVAVSTLITDIPWLCLVLYFIWRNKESVSSIGLTARNWWQEAAIGAVLFVPLMFGMTLLEKALQSGGLSVPQEAPSFLVPTGRGQIGLAIVFLVVVAVSEEVIFRGYLIRRFTALWGNPVAALLLSSAIFAMGHGYERSGGVVGVGVLGLTFGAIYLWRRSLVAPVVMHFIQDFAGIILVPLGVLS